MQDRPPAPPCARSQGETEGTPAAPTAAAPRPASAFRVQLKSSLRGMDGYAAQQAALSPDGDAGRGIAAGGLGGAGRRVDGGAARDVQAATGVDVSHARVHTGAAVDSAARSLGAEGFTLGADVGLAAGAGPSVLYHELGHVAQQTGGGDDGPMAYHQPDVGPSSALEGEADRIAQAAMTGGTATVTSLSGARVQPKRKKQAEAISDDFDPVVEAYLATAHALLGQKAHESDDTDALEAQRKERRKERRTDALGWFVQLAAEGPDIVVPTVQELDRTDDFSALLAFAGYKQIWQDEAAAAAMGKLLPLRDPVKAEADVVELLLWHPFASLKETFDPAVDRWEARMAWELLQVVPESRREALLTWTKAEQKEQRKDGDFRGKDGKEARKENRLRRGVTKRIERNASWEYKESSRFDTYAGNDGKTATTAEVQHGEVVDGKPFATTEDTDRQGLIAQAIDPALWEADDPTHLYAVLAMVVQADEAAVVAPLVKTYWERHEEELTRLHFDQSGSWTEVIHDDTATTWLTRTWNGTLAAFEVLKAALSLGKVRSEARVDLEKVTKALPGILGVRLDGERAKTELTPMEWLAYLTGGADTAAWLLDISGLNAPALIEVLEVGAGAGTALLRILEGVGYVVEGVEILKDLGGDEDAQWKPSVKDPQQDLNMLVLEKDDVSGRMVVSLPLVQLGGVARLDGTTTFKLGGSHIAGAVVETKQRTPHSVDRHVTVHVDAIALNDLMVITPDGMLTIKKIVLEALDLAFIAPEPRPATIPEKIGQYAQVVALQALQAAPLEQVTVLGVVPVSGISDAVFGGIDGYFAYANASAIAMDGDWSQLTLAFGGLRMDGLATSGGAHIDHLEVGATQLSVDTSAAGSVLLGTESAAGVEAEIKKLEDKKRAVDEKLAKAKEKGRDKKTDDLQAQSDWYAQELERLRRTHALLVQIEPKAAQVKALETELQALNAVEAPDAAQAKRKREIGAELTRLNTEIALLKSTSVAITGQLGAVDVKGLGVAGTEVGQVHIDPTTFTAANDAEGKTQGFTAHTGKITVDDVTLGSDRRRDVCIAQEIASIEAGAKQAGRLLTKEESLRIAALKEEAAFLQPFIAEYEGLRGRLRTLDDLERARFLELRQLLEQPASTHIGHVEVTDLDFRADVAGLAGATGGDLAGVGGAGVHVGKVAVTDVTLYETARFTHGGDTHIDAISGSDLDLSATAGPTGISARVQAGDLSVEGVAVGGKRSAAERDRAQLQQELASVQAQIDELVRRNETGARLDALKEEQAALEKALAGLQAEVFDREGALRGFVGFAKAELPKLKHRKTGVDYASGLSAAGARDMVKGAQDAVALIQHGDPKASTPVDHQACIDTANLLIGKYLVGIDTLVAETYQLAAEVAGLEQSGTVEDLQQAKLLKKAIADREADVSTARGLLTQWEQTLVDLQAALVEAEAAVTEAKRLQGVYDGLVAEAKAAGMLSPEIFDTEEKLRGQSALVLIKAAESYVNGYEDLTLTGVSAQGVDVGVSGGTTLLQPLLDSDPATEGLGGGLTLQAGEQGGNLVDRIQVTGVKQGTTELPSLVASNIGGTVQVAPDGTITLQGLSLGEVAMDAIHWESADMGVHVDEALTIRGVTVDATLTSTKTTEKDQETGDTYATTVSGGTLTKLHVDEITSPGLQFRYGDYLIGMGKGAEGAKQDTKPLILKGLDLSELNLTSYEMKALDIESLDTSALSADLGAGMKISAASVRAGQMHVAGILTEAQQQENEDKRGNGEEGVVDEANRYEISVGDLEADALAVKMQDMGLDVRIDALRSGSIGNVYVDFQNGAFGFEGIEGGVIALGPIRYDDGGMTFAANAGMRLETVKVSGHGVMPTDAEVKAARAKGQAPPSFEVLKLDLLAADRAWFPSLDYAAKGAGSSQAVHLDSGYLEALKLSDYDIYARDLTMALEFQNGDLNGLEVKLQDALSSTTVRGSYHVGSLAFASGFDATKGVPFMTVGFQGVSTTDDLTYSGDGSSQDLDGVETTSHTGATVGLTNAGGNLDIRGATTTFSNVTVDALNLPSFDWRAGDTSVTGANLKALGVRIDGYTEGYEEEVAGMPIPRSLLHITRLHVDSIAGENIIYDDGATRVTVSGGQTKDESLTAFQLSNLDVTDLHYIEGVPEGGAIALDSFDAGLDVVSGEAGKSLSVATTLSGGAMKVNFTGGGGGDFSLDALGITEVLVTKELEGGEKIEAYLPSAMVNSLTGDFLTWFREVAGTKEAEEHVTAHVDSLIVQEDGWFEYHRNPAAISEVDEEKAWDDKVKEAKAKQALAAKLGLVDWATLLSTMNGELAFDLIVDANIAVVGGEYEYRDLKAPIVDGRLDYGTLEDSLGWGLTNELIDFEWKDAGNGQKKFVIELDYRRLAWLAGGLAGAGAAIYGPTDLVETEGIDKDQAKTYEKAEEVPLDLLLKGFIEDYLVDKPAGVVAVDEMAGDGPLETWHDKLAESKKKDRVQQIADKEAFVAALRAYMQDLQQKGEQVPWILPIILAKAEQEVNSLRHPEQDGYTEWADAWLENVSASLTFAAPDASVTNVGVGDDATLSYKSIGLAFLEDKSGPIHRYWAGLSAEQLGITADTGAGMVTAGVESAAFGFDVQRLFTDAKVLVYGGMDKDPLMNPIKGAIKAGSHLKGIDVAFDYSQKR